MIRSHRARHRWIWLGLGLLLPALLAAALLARPGQPVNESLPEGVRTFTDSGGSP